MEIRLAQLSRLLVKLIFFTFSPLSLHFPTLLSLFCCLYFAPLFIPLPFISSLLNFSFPAPVSSFFLSAFLSTAIFTRLCDMTGRPVWRMQMSVWQGVVQDCSLTHCPPTCWFVMHLALIALLKCILTCWHGPASLFVDEILLNEF